MQISQKGLDLIKKFEGLYLTAYLDPAGIPTIGYGTIRYPNGQKVKLGNEITEQQAEAYLLDECSKFAQKVEKLVTASLNQNQFDALVSFCYNLGDGALGQSTLLKELNKANYLGAANEFPRWNKATVKGKLQVLNGLVKRRAEEKALFESTEIGGTPIEVDTTPSPQEQVTWLEGYRDGDKNVIVAWKGGTTSEVIEIVTLERPNKEDLIAVLQQYPNAIDFRLAPKENDIPKGERISFSGKAQPIISPSTPIPFPGRLLVRGAEGEDVKILQERLRELSYYLETVHGLFDITTDEAVRAFQSDYFGVIEADGKVGEITWSNLWGKPQKITPETRKGKTYLRLTKTKRKDGHGCFILQLEYIKDGKLNDRLEVCSGQPNKQVFRTGKNSKSGSMEPLPEGKWFIHNILWADGKDNYHGKLFAVKGLGPVTVPLSYKEPGTTGRSAIEIHIDWNKTKGSPGTVGCIGVSNVTDYKRLVTWLRETDPRDLYVDWGLGTCPEPS
ncbi:glycoside hydrolase family protein [Microcoleus sp. FACHB-831]|nr:glycoside hydrolase family protein [Microcoleus sp. FACHB-831]